MQEILNRHHGFEAFYIIANAIDPLDIIHVHTEYLRYSKAMRLPVIRNRIVAGCLNDVIKRVLWTVRFQIEPSLRIIEFLLKQISLFLNFLDLGLYIQSEILVL